jgi:hypothetical protein
VRFDPFDWGQPAVASSGQSLNKLWIVGRIAERQSQPSYGGIDAVVEFHNGVVRPKFTADFVARHQITRPFDQHRQNRNRLLWQPGVDLVFAQLPCP